MISRIAFRSTGTLFSCSTLAILLVAGCGDHSSPTTMGVVTTGGPPMMPMPLVGQASLAGFVRDGAGQIVSGATILVAESDVRATTDASGAYGVMVPSDSTVTLMASADGFAATFHESIMVASQVTVANDDFVLLPPGDLTAINALGAPGQESTRGAMAIRLHSMDPSCTLAGAKLTIWPPLTATVVYGRPSASGGIDSPDPTLTEVQPGTDVAVWLAGALPPGNGILLSIEQSDCRVLTQPPSVDGVMFTGQQQVVAKALTQSDLFLGIVQ